MIRSKTLFFIFDLIYFLFYFINWCCGFYPRNNRRSTTCSWTISPSRCFSCACRFSTRAVALVCLKLSYKLILFPWVEAAISKVFSSVSSDWGWEGANNHYIIYMNLSCLLTLAIHFVIHWFNAWIGNLTHITSTLNQYCTILHKNYTWLRLSFTKWHKDHHMLQVACWIYLGHIQGWREWLQGHVHGGLWGHAPHHAALSGVVARWRNGSCTGLQGQLLSRYSTQIRTGSKK